MMTETNRIEFKQELTAELDLEKEVIAFLNYREGGVLYIGIDKNGVPVGVSDIDGDMLKIKDRIRKNILPSPMGLFDVTAETIDNVDVIKIFIASGTEKPYYKSKYGMSTKGCFLRVGTSSEPMATLQIEDLFSHRVHNSIRNIVSPRQDLTFNKLRIYYEEKGMHLNDNYLRSLELLTDDGRLNYVAYLLSDDNGNSMKVAKYAGPNRLELISNNEYGYSCLLSATQKVLDKLDVENQIKTVITPTGRRDTPQWSKLAIREAVINAIVHNDYSYGSPSKIELFSDHLEITSIGRIPDGMSMQDFFSGVSMPRNKELMRVFRDMEMVEALGSGMLRIVDTYGKDCFEFGDNYIRFKVPYNAVSGSSVENGESVEKNSESSVKNGNTVEKSSVEIAKSSVENAQSMEKSSVESEEKTVEKILKLLSDNPQITGWEIAEKVNRSLRSVEKQLKALRDQGKILHVGPNKGGHWEVNR